jgi:hypothetical protein
MPDPTVEQHFSGRADHVRRIYDTIVDASSKLGPVEQDPKKTSIHLNRRVAFAGIANASPRLAAISDAGATKPPAPGKWSPKQIIGHLIDSASNNHQRFVHQATDTPEK